MSSCQLTTAQQEMSKGLSFRYDAPTLTIERIAVHPYPDLTRLWVRVQLSAFATPVVVQLSCMDQDGQEISDMLLVDWRDEYISLTMHFKKTPVPEATYTLAVQVLRDEQMLATQQYDFPLVFVDPSQEKK